MASKLVANDVGGGRFRWRKNDSGTIFVIVNNFIG